MVRPDFSQTAVLSEIIRRDDAAIVNGTRRATRDSLCDLFGRDTSVMGRAIGMLIFDKLARSSTGNSYAPTAKGRKLIQEGGEVKSGPKPGRRQAVRKTKTDTLQARAWRAILVKKRFTVSEIVAVAAKETDKDPIGSIRRYVNHLSRAGFLTELPRRQPTKTYKKQGEKIFWLRAQHGRLPPRVRKDKDGTPGMFDPNERSYHPFDVEPEPVK